MRIVITMLFFLSSIAAIATTSSLDRLQSIASKPNGDLSSDDVSFLVSCLDSSDDEIVVNSIGTIQRLLWVATYSSEQDDKRPLALFRETKDFVGILMKIMKSGNLEVRRSSIAVFAMTVKDHERLCRTLADCYEEESDDLFIRRDILSVIAGHSLASPEIRIVVTKAISDEHAIIRLYGLKAAGTVMDKTMFASVVPNLTSANEEVRREAEKIVVKFFSIYGASVSETVEGYKEMTNVVSPMQGERQ